MPIRINESLKPSISEGPINRKATPQHSEERIMTTLLSILSGIHCEAKLAGIYVNDQMAKNHPIYIDERLKSSNL